MSASHMCTADQIMDVLEWHALEHSHRCTILPAHIFINDCMKLISILMCIPCAKKTVLYTICVVTQQ